MQLLKYDLMVSIDQTTIPGSSSNTFVSCVMYLMLDISSKSTPAIHPPQTQLYRVHKSSTHHLPKHNAQDNPAYRTRQESDPPDRSPQKTQSRQHTHNHPTERSACPPYKPKIQARTSPRPRRPRLIRSKSHSPARWGWGMCCWCRSRSMPRTWGLPGTPGSRPRRPCGRRWRSRGRSRGARGRSCRTRQCRLRGGRGSRFVSGLGRRCR
jgi:hypothetical protein